MKQAITHLRKCNNYTAVHDRSLRIELGKGLYLTVEQYKLFPIGIKKTTVNSKLIRIFYLNSR